KEEKLPHATVLDRAYRPAYHRAERRFLVATRSSPPESEGMRIPRLKLSTSPPRAEPTADPAATPVSVDSDARTVDVTGLLIAWNEGDAAALDRLLPVVYAELRRQARRALRREAAGHTLQPT